MIPSAPSTHTLHNPFSTIQTTTITNNRPNPENPFLAKNVVTNNPFLTNGGSYSVPVSSGNPFTDSGIKSISTNPFTDTTSHIRLTQSNPFLNSQKSLDDVFFT